MQNLPCGPTLSCPGTTVLDDQFGGPAPDDAHLIGAILRLNDDGTTPEDNPFFEVGAEIRGEVGANIQKIFAYGIRNTFGMAFDPISGDLWLEQNGDDSFTELSRVSPGMNGGWVQIMGPLARVAEYKGIETDPVFLGLQQGRWPPTNIADSPEQARSRLFMLPGARYSDPEFSWKFEVAPAGIGFLNSPALGRQYKGDLFMGAPAPRSKAGTCFASTSRATDGESQWMIRGLRTAPPTTSLNSRSLRVKLCSSAEISVLAPTSKPDPAICSSFRSLTARFTRSSAVAKLGSINDTPLKNTRFQSTPRTVQGPE
jgi:hypothetical protein